MLNLRLLSFRRHFLPAFPLAFHCRLASSLVGESQNTIYALATGGVRCALAVIRVSGPCSGDVLEKIANFPSITSIEPRKATLRKLYDPRSMKILDHGLVLWFPGPKSFTGEDSCEFHVHGGPAVVTSLLKAIASFPKCRMAEPGEFSKRAFLNGKMDLTAVEGLGDLINAETEMQRAQAFSQMSGSLGSLYESWRNRIAKCLANAEALIDFGEDQNIGSNVLEEVGTEILRLVKEMTSHLQDGERGEILRNGVRVAILGRPNVGKSSLLNLMCKRDAAIVSSIPGTTRDVIESCIDFRGYPIVFADTAGIRSSPDEIEREGIRRAFMEAKKAHVILLMMSYTDVCEQIAHLLEKRDQAGGNISKSENCAKIDRNELIKLELDELVAEELDQNYSGAEDLTGKVILVMNKSDLFPSSEKSGFLEIIDPVFDAKISCKTRSGLDHLTDSLVKIVARLCYDPQNESPCLTRERHRSHLQSCLQNLKTYIDPENTNAEDFALKTHTLKLAMNDIGFITGHVGTEDILDIIFRDFCIGK